MIRNTLTPAQAGEMTARGLAELPSDQLADLQEALAAEKASLARLIGKLDEALNIKFASDAMTLRESKGKEYGTVTFTDGDVRVSADLPQTVSWDAEMLAEVASHIRDELGGDPAEYLDVKYVVREARFKAWPASLQALFVPARTTGRGKPTYKLERRG